MTYYNEVMRYNNYVYYSIILLCPVHLVKYYYLQIYKAKALKYIILEFIISISLLLSLKIIFFDLVIF